eukprot:9162848-Pyramimonas_sp.AAC.1
MAKHYATVQWKPPPLGRALPHGGKLAPVLLLQAGDFSSEELAAVLTQMRAGRAAGPDGIPPDLWKALRSDAD